MSINTPAPAGQDRTDPRRPDTGSGAARDHVHHLREDGGTYRGIATAAGLAPATVHDLVSGRRPGTPYTAAALRCPSPARPCPAPAWTPEAPGSGSGPCT